MKHQGQKIILPGIIFMIAVTSVGFAQDRLKHSKTIIINNGDTLFNGKKAADLSQSEKNELKKLIQTHESGDVVIGRQAGDRLEIGRPGPDKVVRVFRGRRADVLNTIPEEIQEVRVLNFAQDTALLSMNGDTLIPGFHRKMKSLDRMTIFPPGEMNIRIPNGYREMEDVLFEAPRPFRENTQSFNYNTTDKDGITTRMNVRISDASEEHVERITGLKEIVDPLKVEDLTLFPNFSNGKMTLSFNLPSKGNTTVRILDNEFKTVFNTQNNAAGVYTKQIDLPKNGIYYIHIKQGDKVFLKKVVKQ